ncbi:unnamed protein product [Brachionus calyciflorus]|uniref:Fibronectin type-III domain-containing protein n=1 Tax=Brachionus calyciflorus TaxID=104777 RepID=A0A814MR67_9BILA|nr:unnamed protein product [Brachionus calyciflorus]
MTKEVSLVKAIFKESNYKLINKTKSFLFFSSNWTNCFGNPDAPSNLTIKTDGKILSLNWKKPLITHSPDICYYKIIRQFLDNSKIDEFIVTETRFNFSGDDLKRDFQVDIYAYNDVECYIYEYPVARYCSETGTNTTYGIPLRYVYRAEPSTTTTLTTIATTTTTNSRENKATAMNKIGFFNLFFIYYFVFILS